MVTFTRIWSVTKRISVGFAVLLLIVLAAGAVYQFIASRLDDGRYPPPGQMVDVGGRGIHLNCTGEGTPTVILESGLGGGSLDWSLVQPEVAKFGRVCSYDRAGITWSSPSEDRRTARQIAVELHRLLDAAHIAPPYVLVGHSIGGLYVQMFASRYTDEVAGVVLVDSSHEDQLTRVSGIPAFVPYLFKVAAPIGIARIVNQWSDAPPNLAADTIAERAALYSHTQCVYAIADEMAAIPESMAELRDSPMRFADKPLIVLSHGLSEGNSPEHEAAWLDLQSSLAKRSSNGKLIIAHNSGHYIQFFEPGLVIDAIRQVVRAATLNH
jgi:pimeloyl-ACP methyl ester carboxylesterase